MIRKTACLFSIAFGASLLAACGSSPSHSAVTSTSSTSGIARASSTTTTTSSSKLTSHGLLTISCTSTNGIELVDPSTGAVLAQETSPRELSTTSVGSVYLDYTHLCGSYGRANADTELNYREQYNAGFTLMAVRAVNTQPDGSQHLGYIDLATGNFTDVTAATAPSGFGAIPPVDKSPVFDTNGDFYFWRTSGCTIYKYVPATNTSTVVGTINGGCDNGTTFLTVRNGVVSSFNNLTASVVPNDPLRLLPANPNTNSDPVVSPDGSSFAFLSLSPGATLPALFTTGMSQGSAPRKVASSFDGILLDWQ